MSFSFRSLIQTLGINKFLDYKGLVVLVDEIKKWSSNQFVNKTTTVNSKPLSSNITLNASDVGAIAKTEKGAKNGVASLDESGKVPSSQLPSYVDDVVEGYYLDGKFYSDSGHSQAITGESGKIYMDKTTGKVYRYSGTTFVIIPSGVALGETSSTAYPGDKGKVAYDHANKKSGNPHGVTKFDVGLSNVTNDKQMKGLATGTTNGHVMAFGADGYTPKDTGFTIGKSVPSNAVFTDTRYSPFTGATSSGAGVAGLVPQPQAADRTKFLSGDGTWKDVSIPDIQAITQEEIEALFQ